MPSPALRCLQCGHEQAEELWTECEIVWWRGPMRGEFIAARFNGLARIEVSWRSVLWPGRAAIPVQKPRVLAALAALERQLEREGWERVGQGDLWYAHRFRRAVSGRRAPGGLEQPTVQYELVPSAPRHMQPQAVRRR